MIAWSEMMAECDGYRAGFVAVFRKYEGEPTDERDGNGRTVKVTVKSFAEHVGIARTTFRDWVGTHRRGGVHHTGSARTGQMARQAVKSEKVSVEDKVEILGDLISDTRVLNQWRSKRAPKVTEADVKAGRAAVSALTEKIVRGANGLQTPMMLDYLKAVVDFLDEYDVSEADLRKFDRLARQLVEEIEVQKFRSEVTA